MFGRAAGRPIVTVVLPTYNRSAFMPAVFDSLARQTFSDWELVVVDDGSADDTKLVVERLAAALPNPVGYVCQQNQGPAAARNRGLDRARGEYVAFFDSDDLWLSGYLERGVTALQANPDLDWVFGPCRVVQLTTGAVVEPNTFYKHGRRRPFLDLVTERRAGGVNVITDERALEYQILHGLYCGPQNSVMNRRMFAEDRFPEHLRVGEDQLLVISALAARRRLGYYEDPQVIYHVHDQNSSGASKPSAERVIDTLEPLVEALSRLSSELPLTDRERRALRKRLGREYFWQLGYNGYWQAGRRQEALALFKKGLRSAPFQVAAWKTYLLAHMKVAIQS